MEAQTASGHRTAPNAAGSHGPRWDWNRLLTPRVVFLMLPVVGLLVAAYWYPARRWEAAWRHQSAWSHGYLIPFIAVLIAHFRLNEFLPRRLTPSIGGLGLIVAGLVLRIWSQTLKYAYPGEATLLLVAAGVVVLLLGWQMLKAVWVPTLYLLLMIPWDPKYYEGIALPLQTLSAAAAERFLAAMGMVVERQRNVLQLSSGPLNVAEACSGLHLLFAFVALGVMMAYLYRRPIWERLVIMGSSVPIAVFCNMVRVTLMALASDGIFFERRAVEGGAPTWSAHVPEAMWGFLGGGGDLAAHLAAFRENVLNPESYLHQGFGFAMMGLAFLLMWAELRVIDVFFVEEEDADRPHTRAPGAPAA